MPYHISEVNNDNEEDIRLSSTVEVREKTKKVQTTTFCCSKDCLNYFRLSFNHQYN